MRHRKSFNHLGRKTGHRKAMLANMATSLILHKRVRTTTAKAKALRIYVEPLITKSKEDSTHSRRVVFSYLQSKEAVTELFREVSPKIIERPGGYTRILKTGNRLGDNADMCIIELVDYNENLLAANEESKSKTGRSRRRRGSKKKTDSPQASATSEAESTVEIQTKKEEAGSAVVKEETKTEGTETIKKEEPAKEAKAEDAGSKAEEKKDEKKEE